MRSFAVFVVLLSAVQLRATVSVVVSPVRHRVESAAETGGAESGDEGDHEPDDPPLSVGQAAPTVRQGHHHRLDPDRRRVRHRIELRQAPLPADPSKVPVNGNFAQIGQPVPDFTLTNQDGKALSLHDFKGKALAITFIYARCPLPDYCTRMSTNFSNLAMQLANDPDKDKIRLLTISFDPENDIPGEEASAAMDP